MGLCSIFWSTLCLYCQYVVLDFEFSRCVCIVSMLCLILNFLGLCLILNFLGLCLILNFFWFKFWIFSGKKKIEFFFFFLVLKKTYSCVFETQLYEALAAFLKHSQNYTHSCVLNAAQSGSIAAFFNPYRLRLIAAFCKKCSYRPTLGCI